MNTQIDFGGRTVVRNLSMQVKRGTIYGFLGPNGSGKTTSIRVLLGLVAADPGGGEIRLLDSPVPAGLPVTALHTRLRWCGVTCRLRA